MHLDSWLSRHGQLRGPVVRGPCGDAGLHRRGDGATAAARRRPDATG